MRRLKIGLLIVAILIFLISLTQSAYYTSASQPDGGVDSLVLLLVGWFGAAVGGAALSWVANPLIIASWLILLKNTKGALITSTLALAFSASFLFFNIVIANEAGDYSTIVARKSGYWLWLTSILFFTIGTIIIYFIEKKQIKETISVL